LAFKKNENMERFVEIYSDNDCLQGLLGLLELLHLLSLSAYFWVVWLLAYLLIWVPRLLGLLELLGC
jgi:hypothetical protein